MDHCDMATGLSKSTDTPTEKKHERRCGILLQAQARRRRSFKRLKNNCDLMHGVQN